MMGNSPETRFGNIPDSSRDPKEQFPLRVDASCNRAIAQ